MEASMPQQHCQQAEPEQGEDDDSGARRGCQKECSVGICPGDM